MVTAATPAKFLTPCPVFFNVLKLDCLLPQTERRIFHDGLRETAKGVFERGIEAKRDVVDAKAPLVSVAHGI